MLKRNFQANDWALPSQTTWKLGKCCMWLESDWQIMPSIHTWHQDSSHYCPCYQATTPKKESLLEGGHSSWQDKCVVIIFNQINLQRVFQKHKLLFHNRKLENYHLIDMWVFSPTNTIHLKTDILVSFITLIKRSPGREKHLEKEH